MRLRPSRRADAQDLFYANRIAHVTSVHEDVDGDHHIGVVLEDAHDAAQRQHQLSTAALFDIDSGERLLTAATR